jgi:hypothetical protein
VKTFILLDNFGVLNILILIGVNLKKTDWSITKKEETIKLNGQHYEVRLPYKPEQEYFLDSRPVTFHRMRCTDRKIAKLDLVEQYNKKVSE